MAVSGDKLQLIQGLEKTNRCSEKENVPPGGRKKARDMMPITMAKPGERYLIQKITGRDEVRQRLAELGFVLESEVAVVSELGGNLILQVKDSRVALDKGMASRILVG